MPAPPEGATHKPHFHRNVSWKQPVRVATTGAGTLASSFEDGDSVDGVTLATGDRILVKNQGTGSENGIYRVNATGAPTRDYDMDNDAEVVGAVVYVVAGTDNGGTLWRCTNTTTPTIGTTALTFAEVSGGSSPPGGGAADMVTVVVDGGGAAITGNPAVDVVMPADGDFTEWTILASPSGSITFDVWKDTYGNFPPDSGDSITSASPPTLSSAVKATDSTLAGWTTGFSAGDIFRIRVASSSSVSRVTLALAYDRS